MKYNYGLAALAFSLVATATSVHAGGFSRGTADTDILFEDGTFTTRDSVTYVNPNRKFDKKGDAPGLNGKKFSETYYIPSLAAKVQFGDRFACAATYTTAYGGDTDYDGIMDKHGKVREKFTDDEYGLTCAVFQPLAVGRLAFIGGAFISDFNYDLTGNTRSPLGGLTGLNVDLDDTAVGYRLGLAYEIPNIAFRTQVMYRSGTDYTASGGAHLPALGVDLPAAGFGGLPQSVEWKTQSGIAKDWLAYGSVKWTDWSELQRLHLKFGPQDFYNEYHYNDGWTITGGLGHKFNDTFSGFAQVTWDKSVSTGWDPYGSTVTVAAGTSIHDKFGGDTRLVVAAIHTAAESEDKYGPLNSSTKASWGYALQASYKLKF